jgi:hypothetical protein
VKDKDKKDQRVDPKRILSQNSVFLSLLCIDVQSYSRALSLFRKEGASKRANECFKRAFETNRFVPFSLKKIPKQQS